LKVIENLPKKFNFLHYRYEHDFVSHFIKKGGKFPKLNSIIDTNLFKESNLPIYLATSSAAEIYQSLLTEKNIFFMDETKLPSFNFEEAAFVDFMVGKMAQEVCGHSRSAFSNLLNQYKNTNNFYDINK
jgi:hypothetical protein